MLKVFEWFMPKRKKLSLKEERLSEIGRDTYKSQIFILADTDSMVRIAMDEYLKNPNASWDMVMLCLIKGLLLAKNFYKDYYLPQEDVLQTKERLKEILKELSEAGVKDAVRSNNT